MIIKVCGMRDPENIREVAALGVDWIGLIFFARSQRRITNNGQLTIDNGLRLCYSHVRTLIESSSKIILNFLQISVDIVF